MPFHEILVGFLSSIPKEFSSVAMLSDSSDRLSDWIGVEKTLCDVLVRFAVVLVC